MPRAGEKTAQARASAQSLAIAKTLADDVEVRVEIPVRMTFVRSDRPDRSPPLARLVSTRGRGGAVPLKLYLALIWRCSGEPFSTDLLARQWARLLDLDQPNSLGARRITNALEVLEKEGLVALRRRRGESTVVTLLEESGSGAPYSLPSTASATAKSDDEKRRNRYFKVPIQLWVRGYIQEMGAPALAMLLLLLADRNLDGRPTWWSVERFKSFDISPTNRTSGTKELERLQLVRVTKALVDPGRNGASFRRERVRNNYRLRGPARPAEMIKAAQMRKQAAGQTETTGKTTIGLRPRQSGRE